MAGGGGKRRGNVLRVSSVRVANGFVVVAIFRTCSHRTSRRFDGDNQRLVDQGTRFLVIQPILIARGNGRPGWSSARRWPCSPKQNRRVRARPKSRHHNRVASFPERRHPEHLASQILRLHSGIHVRQNVRDGRARIDIKAERCTLARKVQTIL